MSGYFVLLPSILVDDEQDVYWQIKNDDWHFYVIDEVQYNGTAEDCREWLVNHDWYSPYIVCIEVDTNLLSS